MQSIKLLFLALLLAHILGSLLFQTNRDSSRQSAKVYAKDGLFYFLAMLACLFLALDRLPWIKTILWLAAFTAIHLTLDHSRRFIYKIKGSLNGALSHVIDQFLHLGCIVALSAILGHASWRQIADQIRLSGDEKEKLFLIAVFYAGTIFAGGYLIRYLTRSLLPKSGPASEDTGKTLSNAGMYIGWLERFMVLTAILMQSPALVGLIFTGKSIARFPEFKEDHFAEYFLIGTLLSLSCALLAGLALNRMIYGNIVLK